MGYIIEFKDLDEMKVKLEEKIKEQNKKESEKIKNQTRIDKFTKEVTKAFTEASKQIFKQLHMFTIKLYAEDTKQIDNFFYRIKCMEKVNIYLIDYINMLGEHFDAVINKYAQVLFTDKTEGTVVFNCNNDPFIDKIEVKINSILDNTILYINYNSISIGDSAVLYFKEIKK
jgi:hypothetical protein